MNLIQQFPNISEQVRAKFKMTQKHRKPENIWSNLPCDDRQTKFHENEFRKWHIKLVFIIAGTITLLYTFIFNATSIFMWIVR